MERNIDRKISVISGLKGRLRMNVPKSPLLINP